MENYESPLEKKICKLQNEKHYLYKFNFTFIKGLNLPEGVNRGRSTLSVLLALLLWIRGKLHQYVVNSLAVTSLTQLSSGSVSIHLVNYSYSTEADYLSYWQKWPTPFLNSMTGKYPLSKRVQLTKWWCNKYIQWL